MNREQMLLEAGQIIGILTRHTAAEWRALWHELEKDSNFRHSASLLVVVVARETLEQAQRRRKRL